MHSFRRFAAVLTLGLTSSFAFASAPQASNWVASWGAAPVPVPNTKALLSTDTTIRDVVHLSLGGPSLRIIISNEFGTEPLTIGAASVALVTGTLAGEVKPETLHPVLFAGQPSVTIPAGAHYVSDPVNMPVAAFADLAVNLFVPGQKLSTLTWHSSSATTNYLAEGNQVTSAALSVAKTVTPWLLLKGVDVAAGEDGATIVAFGDSITDGAGSSIGANNRWPDVLARRLQANKKLDHLGVVDEGIGGNRILHDVTGPNALARFDRDVIAQDGVKYVVILESINDIGRTAFPNANAPNEGITSAQLIAGLQQMIERAHAHGIKVIGATLTPYEGAKYFSPEGEQMREDVNNFIRTSGKFDGVVDFEHAVADPAHPKAYLAADDHGDHLHPSDAGYNAMGAAFDLKLFAGGR